MEFDVGARVLTAPRPAHSAESMPPGGSAPPVRPPGGLHHSPGAGEGADRWLSGLAAGTSGA